MSEQQPQQEPWTRPPATDGEGARPGDGVPQPTTPVPQPTQGPAEAAPQGVAAPQPTGAGVPQPAADPGASQPTGAGASQPTGPGTPQQTGAGAPQPTGAGVPQAAAPAAPRPVGAVAVDPRRQRRRIVLSGAAAAVIIAAIGVGVAVQGAPATETSAVTAEGTATAPSDTPSSGSDSAAGSSSDPFGGSSGSSGSSSATDPGAGSSDPSSGWGGARAGRGYGAYPGSADTGTAQTNETQAVAATASQQTGVVTITAELGYEEATSAGTGMILTSDGLVLTNNHVVEGATSITVTDESTGREYTATVLGTDATSDVALLQLDGASGLTPVTLDDDTDGVADGDTVTAVGNAEGTGDLVAATGSVTGTDQTMTATTETGGDAETLDGLIEFQADVVSGDSGGPLLDDEGEVVGMTTAASSGPGATTAYAIDISDALTIAGQIESGTAGDGVTIGYPAFLGVWFSADSAYGSGYGSSGGSGSALGSSGGALIAGVLDGTPAASAGLAAGDVITAVDGTTVSSSSDLSTALDAYRPGDQVTITWTSGTTGASSSATVTLVAGPVD